MNDKFNIHKTFPNLRWENEKHIASGWDHDIIMLDKKFVVRIPKNTDALKRAPIDFCLMKYLQDKIDVAIPESISLDTKSKIGLYTVVSGAEMTDNIYKKFNSTKKDVFAKVIALFLLQLHSLPTADILKCKVPKIDITSEN